MLELAKTFSKNAASETKHAILSCDIRYPPGGPGGPGSPPGILLPGAPGWPIGCPPGVREAPREYCSPVFPWVPSGTPGVSIGPTTIERRPRGRCETAPEGKPVWGCGRSVVGRLSGPHQ